MCILGSFVLFCTILFYYIFILKYIKFIKKREIFSPFSFFFKQIKHRVIAIADFLANFSRSIF